MKIPLYSIIVPPLRKNSRLLRRICSNPLLKHSSIYVCILGVLGGILSLMDIIRIIKCGSVLPSTLWRPRIETGKVISAEGERDMKLISLVLSFEYYVLLVLGVLMQNPTLFMPWLLLYTTIITLEFINFFIRLFLGGINFSKHNLIMSMFIVYNWLTVFCAFSRMLGACDYR